MKMTEMYADLALVAVRDIEECESNSADQVSIFSFAVLVLFVAMVAVVLRQKGRAIHDHTMPCICKLHSVHINFHL